MKSAAADIKRDYRMVVSKKFYGNIKHVLFINRIVGLFPVSVTSQGESYKLEWSWMKVIIGNVFVLTFAILTLTGLLLSYSIEEVYNIRIKGFASLMVTLSENITLLMTWVIGQSSISMLFKEFWKYLYYLTKSDEIMGPSEPRRQTIMLIFFVFFTAFTCLGMDIYMWAKIVIPLVGIFEFMWKLVPFYFTRLEKLNKVMESYINLSVDADIFHHSYLSEHHGRRRDNKKDSNNKGKCLLQYKMLTSSIIKSFIKVYGNIAEANIALNKLFGINMTMILLNIIVCFVITPYILYQQILNAKENKFIFTQSFWMACHILRLLLIVEPCYASQTLGMETRRLVMKMICLDLPEEVHRQVKILLMLVTESKIRFNARGMTFINRTLFPTIGSAVFTYLAILFQYKNNN